MNLSSLGLFLLVPFTLHGKSIELPDPLTKANGEKVASAKQWRKERRPEILELFRENVYGRAPVGRPKSLKFETFTTPGMMDGKAVRKQVTISYGTERGKGAINVVMFVPANAKKPVPCFVFLCNRGRNNIDPTRANKTQFWPAEEIIARGYATAAFHVGDVLVDQKDNNDKGVHAIFDAPGTQAKDNWGTIAAWAWGASRVMDYLETDKSIDKKRVGVVGHSRGGKTAMWAAAQDERFALSVSNNSGSTGAALARGKTGEDIKTINRVFPHWFNENYKSFNDRENELPVDQHMLAALIAPRLLYIASSKEDATADPEAEFATAVNATPVYEFLGAKGLTTKTMPATEQPLQDGNIAYHIREGEHDLLLSDWNRFMDFTDKRFSK